MLKLSGFIDIENERGHLKTYDRRTIAFDNREQIRDFFIRLDHYLNDNLDVPDYHREILSMYSQGKYIVEIAPKVQKSTWTVKQIIKAYKQRFLNGEF